MEITESRVHKSKKNVIYGLVVTLINTLIAFAIRTVFINTLGDEALGLNSLFTEIITILSLAELGFGMAIVYNLYRPIQEKNEKRISQLMSLYKITYNIIFVVVLVLGLCVMPFCNFLVKDVNFSQEYLKLVFMMFVFQSASTYLFSYKTSLLNADQKQYIVSFFTAIIKLVFTAIFIVILYLTKNYILYLSLIIIQNVITNFCLSIYVTKKYPFLNSKEKLEKHERKEVFSDVKNIFVKRISGVITTSTDNIMISTMISTLLVGYYSNYVLILSVARTIKRQLTNGVAASIGNLSVSESPEKNIIVLKRLTFIFFVFGSIICSGLLALSSLFIKIWLGEDYILPTIVVYAVIINLFIEIVCEPLWQFLEVSGLFKIDKYIGIIGSVINLIVSLTLGLKIGILGIIIGTISTQLIQLVLKIALLYKRKYNKSPVNYYLIILKIFISFSLVVGFNLLVNEFVVFSNDIVLFLIKGIIAFFIGLIVSLIFYINTDELKYATNLTIGISKNAINKLLRKKEK